jgi:hypothetical protein
MCPHADDFHGFDIVQDLVNQPILNIDSSGISAGKVSHKLFVWRWVPVGVFSEDVQ